MITKFDVEMFHDASWKPVYFGESKGQVKVTRHKNRIFVRLQTERNITACCARKLRWVFPTAILRRTSHAGDTGFTLRHFPRPMLLPTAGFSVRGFFVSQLASGKNHCRRGYSRECCWLLLVVMMMKMLCLTVMLM